MHRKKSKYFTPFERALYRLGFFVERATKVAELDDLIKMLRPHPCSVELIRIGSDGDGGYIVPNDFDGVGFLFSPGVGAEWSFELDFISKSGGKVFLCDPDPVTDDCPFEVSCFSLGPDTGDGVVSLEDWISEVNPDSGDDLALQMDIEGSEYMALMACPSKVLARFRIMVIEFHFVDRILNDKMYNLLFRPLFLKLTKEFDVVFLHPNNAGAMDRRSGIDIPQSLEVTFYRKDRNVGEPFRQEPSSLERVNIEGVPELKLSSHWLGTEVT